VLKHIDRAMGNQMYLSELLGGLRRRWWIVLVGLLGTAVLTAAAFMLVPPKQDVQASLMVLPPAKSSSEAGNPYLVLQGLGPAADMLAAAMNSGAVHESLAPEKGSGTFEVSRDTTSSGPMLLVKVTDTDPQRALALLDAVIKRMPAVLANLQSQVAVRPASNLLSLTEVTRDVRPVPSLKGQLRATLATAVGGLAITLFGTNALDGLLLRRSARRRESAADSADDDATPAEGSPSTLTWADSTA
jgi:hypothetical protein